MEGAPLFAEARVSGRHSVFGQAMLRGRGVGDVLVDLAVRGDDTQVFRAYCILRDVERDALESLMADFEARYGEPPRFAESGPDDGRVLFDVPLDKVEARFSGALLAFQASFGAPWLHFQGGHVMARVHVVDCEPPDCEARLRKFLGFAGLDASVGIVEMQEPQLSAWHELRRWRADLAGRVDDEWPDARVQTSVRAGP